MNNDKKYGLVAPTVPVADTDGLIKTVDLETDIIIHFPVWYGAKPQDSYQLLVDGTLVGELVRFPDPVPVEGSVKTLTIPVNTQLRQDGRYSIGYRATPFPGGTSADSAMTSIHIDRTPPGAALLAPIIFPSATFGDSLSGLIPGYAGMGQGDVIQAVCNEMNGPTTTVAPEHLTTSPINIKFEREFLSNLQSDEITVYYQVTDRAGNVSAPSNASSLTLTI
ncbi:MULTISPECIES: hypothetical protein [unclassified Pseudomonas]|uniref:hypothetical protein n=2 Tax=Pseudomonas TaxID=286 RepID=UPI002AC943AF|nr:MULTISPECIES: hypothetical protein [unclassified Pseudomonas]MEB0077910.1 hypothetical protein [Pseudomonas sp. MH10out]MEB0093875.1 hypothetical protein [Pseudomonas sp. CCI4.2]MEB0129502.1 hypothetical protein [Pseudomonas sp. CCI2.4]MEB0157322.1 hypothetical protein [Pseudomonas sp. AH2 (2023)]MEB0166540.1 hypothetical protein [Pseudomonas sp. CCC4.4]